MNNTEKINRVCAVIPFYNEKQTLKNIVNKTLNFVDEVIAVNDGSTDGSCDELNGIEKVSVINFDKNCGKGVALKAGFYESVKQNFDFTVTIDADLQHDPTYIPLLLKETDAYDIVIGNRLNDLKTMPLHRRLSNKITSYLLSKKLKVKIEDSQCGFRAYRTNIPAMLQTKFNGFEAESEILVRAVRNNMTIGFVDIPTIYGNEKSKIKSIQAILGFIKVILS